MFVPSEHAKDDVVGELADEFVVSSRATPNLDELARVRRIVADQQPVCRCLVVDNVLVGGSNGCVDRDRHGWIWVCGRIARVCTHARDPDRRRICVPTRSLRRVFYCEYASDRMHQAAFTSSRSRADTLAAILSGSAMEAPLA